MKMTKDQIKYANEEFLRIIGLYNSDPTLIHAHNPDMQVALANMIISIANNRLKPVRCMVKTLDEGGIPVHQFTIELANYGDK